MEENEEEILTEEEILNEVKNIYGLEENLETLKTYNSYIQMKQENQINFGNYNIFINNKSDYDSCEKLVDIIWKLLYAHGVVSTPYRYLNRNDFRMRNGSIDMFDEELLIIDDRKMDYRLLSLLSDIKEIVPKYDEKIFIIINNDERIGENLLSDLTKCITWTMKVEKISFDDKSDYISKTLMENNIKLKSPELINQLSKEPFWKVQEKVFSFIVECKKDNITELDSNVLNEKFGYKLKEKVVAKKSNESGFKELDDLVGLEDVKKQIYQIANYVKVSKNRGKMPMLHMCFMGNPGSAKTTVARLVGKIFGEMEILSSKGNFVEVQRCDLIGKYVGHTAPQTMEKIKQALGGVLFIDEAYSLVNNGGRDFGQECVATLLKEMEDERDNLCVILAGYTQEMENMLKTNPGFESRIQFKINFPDYSEEELYNIFKKFAKEEGFKVSSNIKSTVIEYFKNEKKKENFANGRCVRNLFEKVKMEQADRVVKTKENNIDTIIKADVQNVINGLNISKTRKTFQIGFAS